MARTKKPSTSAGVANSERPLEELLILSQSIADDFFRRVYGSVKIASPILNAAAKRRIPSSVAFLDLRGLKALLAEEYRADNGKIALAEYQLREKWRAWEYHQRCYGKDVSTPPTGRGAEDIAQEAAFVKIAIEEAAHLEKSIAEGDAKETTQRKSQRFGVCKRDENGRIRLVDGMAVNKKGVITEIGQHVDAYLGEIMAERLRKRGATSAA